MLILCFNFLIFLLLLNGAKQRQLSIISSLKKIYIRIVETNSVCVKAERKFDQIKEKNCGGEIEDSEFNRTMSPIFVIWI